MALVLLVAIGVSVVARNDSLENGVVVVTSSAVAPTTFAASSAVEMFGNGGDGVMVVNAFHRWRKEILFLFAVEVLFVGVGDRERLLNVLAGALYDF